MTSSAAVRTMPLPDHRHAVMRLLAAVLAFTLAGVVAVVPGARAATADDLIATTVSVSQYETWWPAGARHLDVRVTTPDGELVHDGGLLAEVNGIDYSGSSTWASGRLPIHAEFPAAGTYPVTVRYFPAAGYAGSEWTGTVEVSEGTVATTTTVVDAPEQLHYGDRGAVDVQVDVRGEHLPSGVVELWSLDTGEFVDQERVGAGGRVRLHLREVLPGNESFEVVFVPYGGLQRSRAELTVPILKAERDLDAWVVGGSVDPHDTWWKVAVDVPDVDRVAGTLALYAGDRRLARIRPDEEHNRTEVFVIESDVLPPGNHRLHVRLTGSPTVEDTSADVVLRVAKVESDMWAREKRQMRWGVDHRLLVRTGAETSWSGNDGHFATGTVTVYRGRTKVGSEKIRREGETTVRIDGHRLRVGRTTLRVVYSGDSRYASSTSYETVRVRKAKTKVRAKVVDKTVNDPQRAKVKVRVKSPSDVDPTGKIKIKADGKTVKKVRLKKRHDGSRTVKLPGLSDGHHTIKVVYTGSSKTKRAVKNNLYVWFR
ncbi:Ig-like domain-containing protein [Isoptericola sp. CG 20/1183]|uniref:Ig-like domain-containing protein n=1 Tax=Isoptericola halotolerans TaxID=300560 RepID=A0ABX5EKM8_9MICO|nr:MULTISPECIES: Ig-like domain-containing protein [Isoptericola]PRZ02867.1 Ig-like domain-containing protein [Isoptericola sp. CG 20/1183]PRZ09864.1 Ig-like domain-containing protein [Isoptericola halotolerans]